MKRVECTEAKNLKGCRIYHFQECWWIFYFLFASFCSKLIFRERKPVPLFSTTKSMIRHFWKFQETLERHTSTFEIKSYSNVSISETTPFIWFSNVFSKFQGNWMNLPSCTWKYRSNHCVIVFHVCCQCKALKILSNCTCKAISYCNIGTRMKTIDKYGQLRVLI